MNMLRHGSYALLLVSTQHFSYTKASGGLHPYKAINEVRKGMAPIWINMGLSEAGHYENARGMMDEITNQIKNPDQRTYDAIESFLHERPSFFPDNRRELGIVLIVSYLETLSSKMSPEEEFVTRWISDAFKENTKDIEEFRERLSRFFTIHYLRLGKSLSKDERNAQMNVELKQYMEKYPSDEPNKLYERIVENCTYMAERKCRERMSNKGTSRAKRANIIRQLRKIIKGAELSQELQDKIQAEMIYDAVEADYKANPEYKEYPPHKDFTAAEMANMSFEDFLVQKDMNLNSFTRGEYRVLLKKLLKQIEREDIIKQVMTQIDDSERHWEHLKKDEKK